MTLKFCLPLTLTTSWRIATSRDQVSWKRPSMAERPGYFAIFLCPVRGGLCPQPHCWKPSFQAQLEPCLSQRAPPPPPACASQPGSLCRLGLWIPRSTGKGQFSSALLPFHALGLRRAPHAHLHPLCQLLGSCASVLPWLLCQCPSLAPGGGAGGMPALEKQGGWGGPGSPRLSQVD